jgi:molecular chaperone DnaK (HSP70)
VPASHTEEFSTALDGQNTFGVKLVVRETATASALIDVAVPLQHPAAMGVPRIDFIIKVDDAGHVTVDANEVGGTGKFHRDDLIVAVD